MSACIRKRKIDTNEYIFETNIFEYSNISTLWYPIQTDIRMPPPPSPQTHENPMKNIQTKTKWKANLSISGKIIWDEKRELESVYGRKEGSRKSQPRSESLNISPSTDPSSSSPGKKILQELRMLSSVTINCQITKIVMKSGSQLSEL